METLIEILKAKLANLERAHHDITGVSKKELRHWLNLLGDQPTQMDMFAKPNVPELPSEVPTHDTPTSIKAAKKVEPTFKNTMGKFLMVVQAYPHGLIRDSFCAKTGTKPQTACGALNSLENAGFLYCEGERPNRDGNDCKVYRITEKGLSWVNAQQQ